jgi:Leucine-rich repeat (LRR) protein
MSFRQEMVRRKLLATRIRDKEAAKSTIVTAIPLAPSPARTLSTQSHVPLLQKIKEGKDLDHLCSVMDIRLLKCVQKNETSHEASEKIQSGSGNSPDAASCTESSHHIRDATAAVLNDNSKKKSRLRSMHDLLEALPEKSCEEFLYDCIPQLLTTSKDSANYFLRRSEQVLSESRFQFADVYSDYPAEKRNVESSLKSAAESGSFQNDILSSIPLKTTKTATLLRFDVHFERQSTDLDIESLEQAAFALQPALSRLLSLDPETMQTVTFFEAVEQHQWWCAASRGSNTTALPVRTFEVDNSSVNLGTAHCDEVDAQNESKNEEFTSIHPTSLNVGEISETNELHTSQIEREVRDIQKPLSAEEIAQEGVVSCLYTEACNALCTPIIDWLQRHPFVNVVNVSHLSLRNNGISSLAVIIMNSSRIELLDILNNGVSHVGMRHLCSSLLESKTIREVRLDCNPLGHKGAIQLSGALCCNRLNTSIEALSLSCCKLGDDGCAAIFKSLLGAVKMRSLNLSLNGAEIETAKAATDVLPLITGLERLCLRWNNFKGSAAVVFCQGAMNNRSITDMDLSCNSFGDVDAVSHLGEAIKAMNHLKNLDVSYNKIDGRGAYILGSALETNHHVSNCNFSGNPIGMIGARVLSQLVLATGSEQSSRRGRKIIFENCNIQYVDVTLFDTNKTNGKYELDLSDNYSRIVIDSILRMRDLNQGEILEGSIKMNGVTLNKMTWKEDTTPKSGFLQFQFESIHHFPPKNEDCLSSKQVSSIKELLRPCHDEKQRLSMFAMLIGNHDYFSLDQAREILEMFQDSANRVALVLLLSFQIAPAQQKSLLEQLLTFQDFQSQSIRGLSNFVLDFTILNPTCHYRLILDCDDDRRLMDLLMKVRSDVKRRRQVSFATHKPASIQNICNDLEWCILNTKWNGKDFRVLAGWMPPSHGVLDFDFTASLSLSKLLIEHDDFCMRLSHCSSDMDRYILLRQLSNSFSFCIKSALFFLETISTNQILEDCIVCLFDSIYEIAGFQCILSGVGPSCRDNVIRSVGIHNCWCSGWIVAYHIFDLSDAGHRFVFQQLIALAFTEPGESMVDVHYDDKEFTIPVHWQEDVPFQGICSFFYCRQQAVLDEYYSSFGKRAMDYSVWKAHQPAGVDWVHARKRGNIKDRIKEKFPNPEAAFQSMDRDGGGSISRLELGTELRKLGIWLQVQSSKFFCFLLYFD